MPIEMYSVGNECRSPIILDTLVYITAV